MAIERRVQDGAATTVGVRRSLFSVRRSPLVVRLFILRLSMFAVLNATAAVLASAAQEPSFRSGSSELVVLTVVVTDKQGRSISNLPSARFTVFDNGRRVPIEIFSNEDTPVTVGLVVDASGSMRPKIGEVIAASLRFARSSNPQDELFAIRFNDDVQDVMPERPFLLAGDLGDLERAVGGIRPDGRTALYDGLMSALDHVAQGSRARKVLIVVSDGGDNASDARLEAVLARARASNVAIYTIGVYDADDLDKNPGVLKSLAHTTGGARFLPRSPGELLTVCERIAREIRGGYTIGYVPPAQDGAFHRVRIEIGAPDGSKFNIRTRPGYFAAGRIPQP
jgi:Ca-activated chloride channel homolog